MLSVLGDTLTGSRTSTQMNVFDVLRVGSSVDHVMHSNWNSALLMIVKPRSPPSRHLLQQPDLPSLLASHYPHHTTCTRWQGMHLAATCNVSLWHVWDAASAPLALVRQVPQQLVSGCTIP